ncbi:MAG: hypothetical protein LAO77_10630 [Acidobacteriia bacterium]|nr:hypothetical protein [Terriglobia bacterium]
MAWWLSRGPGERQFADLREPRFTRMSGQRMLVVEATGDPTVVSGGAIKLLFNTYFKLKGVSRVGRPPAPRARWRFSLDTPREKWAGQYALPVPDSVAEVPAEPAGPMRVTIATWEYGDVAEVLHVGPYSAERPDIDRLHAFIASNGYRAVGDHEEEYVKGPGMIFAGDPGAYLTIIRLRVEKSPAQ